MRTPSIWLLIALMGGAMLVGCGSIGGASNSGSAAGPSTSGATTASKPGKRSWAAQDPATALAACRGPVEKARLLSARDKEEITVLCARISNRVKDNTAIIRAVCQELASATSTATDSSAAKRTYADCFAGYIKTVPKSGLGSVAVPSSSGLGG